MTQTCCDACEREASELRPLAIFSCIEGAEPRIDPGSRLDSVTSAVHALWRRDDFAICGPCALRRLIFLAGIGVLLTAAVGLLLADRVALGVAGLAGVLGVSLGLSRITPLERLRRRVAADRALDAVGGRLIVTDRSGWNGHFSAMRVAAEIRAGLRGSGGEVKWCGQCNERVPIALGAHDSCPWCHVNWSEQQQTSLCSDVYPPGR